MLIDYHTHILPGIDDGAETTEISLEMIEILKCQGVGQIIATPHFYAHREKSAENFLEKRQSAYEKLNKPSVPVLLGAEVAVEHGISEIKGIEKLAIQGTNLILLELPYDHYRSWMSEEIYNISAEYGLKVIIAHVHRYTDYYTKEQMESILRMDAIFQINNEALKTFRSRRFVRTLIKSELPVVFGSDCHNISKRSPNWNLPTKKIKAEFLEASNEILSNYKI